MSNPTTPFGWQMPENTDLVTDLPADFEVFGQAVATDLQYLLGGTTGQVLAKASATDLDFDWVAATAGDIEGVTAGIGISGGGTSGTVTVTNSMATAIDAKGDLVAGTGADAFSRLAVGTNGQVLTANSAAATGLEYTTISAGGMTLISTTSLSGATTTLSSIPQTYNSLFLIITGMTGNTSDANFRGMLNNSTNAASYTRIRANTVGGVANDRIEISASLTTLRTNADNAWAIQINNYTSTTTFKPFNFYGRFVETGASNQTCFAAGAFTDITAISSIVFDYGGTNTFSGGTVLLYGVK